MNQVIFFIVYLVSGKISRCFIVNQLLCLLNSYKNLMKVPQIFLYINTLLTFDFIQR